MSEWDALDEYDRAWPIALALADAEDEARRCPSCGGDPGECQDADNQHAFVVDLRRCYKTRAIEERRKARKEDNDGVLFVARLDPTRKKSARKG